jgi:hypothetical protein
MSIQAMSEAAACFPVDTRASASPRSAAATSRRTPPLSIPEVGVMPSTPAASPPRSSTTPPHHPLPCPIHRQALSRQFRRMGAMPSPSRRRTPNPKLRLRSRIRSKIPRK